MSEAADVVVVGAGLAGLVVVDELLRHGKRVIVVDQENEASFGGQAFWSFGGLFLVDSAQQRRMGVRDSVDLAWGDWQRSAAWDRMDGVLAEDEWAAKWGRAFVEFAGGEMASWISNRGIALTPMVGWAERGSLSMSGHGNSVPRFHVAWGTGTGVIGPFARRAQQAARDGRLRVRFRHRVDSLIVEDGVCHGVSGTLLARDDQPRGVETTRETVGEFELRASAVVVASGGIGGDHEKVRRWWPERLGQPPSEMITGVPASVDGRMLDIVAAGGGRLVNRDRMWHYTEGVRNHDPIWPDHAIRILPGPSALWLDALGRRLPIPALPGFDTLETLRILRTDPALVGHDHSWFIATRKIAAKEFALSGSEQNPDITGRKPLKVVASRLTGSMPSPLQAFLDRGEDFVQAECLDELVRKMNDLTDVPLLDPRAVEAVVAERDRAMANPFGKDAQVLAIHNARRYRGDRLARVTRPHRLVDAKAGPLIAVRLRTLTRKSLGGIQTDLEGRVRGQDGQPVPGLYAAGEAAGFGGGGAHGYNALEGTFLGGCLFTGLTVARSLQRGV
ncbi:FAD-binding dehydrogenase [Microbacterium sp. MYb64]|uniref:FAD-binding dehydrogenase n=1 Tax=Microbacterium sp. MYb64 TaxID=1848691 RepID=UPI000CFC3524|nr:FAD-binding dehydrogenase [Microbacterium sp. MYb64]PRB03438.1 FAD-binding dehydrogenase [Microbacterium sp. MYb64]